MSQPASVAKKQIIKKALPRVFKVFIWILTVEVFEIEFGEEPLRYQSQRSLLTSLA